MAIDLTPFADLARQLRELNPDKATWTDDRLLWDASQQAEQQGVLDQFPELQRYKVDSMKDARGIMGEAAGAFGSGVDRMQAQLYDTAALAGDAVGNESLQQWGDEGRDRNEAEAAKFKPIIGALEQVKTDSDFGYWLTNIVASQTPQIGGTVVAGGLAAVAAPEAALAGLLGAGAFGFTQMQNYGSLKEMGGEDVVPIAIANGLIGSALEAMGPASIISRVVKGGIKKEVIQGAAKTLMDRVPAPIMRAALAAAKEGKTEMLTEIAQESLTIGSEIISNRHNENFAIDDNQIVSRLVNSGAAGFVLGGGIGGASGYVSSRNNAADTSTAVRPMEQSAPVVEASFDAVIPPLSPRPMAATPSGASASGSPIVSPTPEAPVLATAEQQAALVQLGMTPAEAATVPATEADLIIQRATPKTVVTPVAQPTGVVAQPTAAPNQIAAQQADQLAAQQALERAELEAEAREELAQSQPDVAQSPTIAPAPQVAKIIPFPVPQQPGETRLTPTAEGEPAVIKPTLTPAEIRQRANMYRNEGDAVFLDFKTGDVLPIRNVAPVEPALRVLPDETKTKTPAAPVAAPAPAAAPVATVPTQAPVQTVATEIPYLDNRLVSDRYVEGAPLELGDTTKLSRQPGDAERVTRNAAILRTADGQTVFAPVYTDRSGQVYVSLRENVKQKDVIPQVAAQAEAAFGKKFSNITVQRILEGTISEAKPENAARNQRIREMGKKLGYARRDQPIAVPLSDLQKQMSAEIVGVHHFEKPVPAGIREFPGKPEDLALAIKAARQKSGDVYKEGLLNPSGVSEVVSLNAGAGEGVTGLDVVPDTSAVAPGRAAPALPEPSAPVRTPATISAASNNVPPHEQIGFSMEQSIDLAEQVGDVDALLKLKAAELTNKFRDEFRNEILSKEQRAVFDLLSADDQLRAMRGALTEAKINGGDDLVLHRKQPDDYRASVTQVRKMFNRVLRAAALMGIDVSVFGTNEGAANKFFQEEGGAYSPSKRAITLVTNDALHPSWQNLITALHEVVHDVVAQESFAVQLALHDMIERLPLGESAFYKNPDADPRVAQGDGPAIERLVEHLTLRGLSQEHSAGLIAQIIRAIKHAYHKVALYLQTKFLGEANTSGKLAMAYAENRVAQILAGDLEPASFLSQFGSKPTMGTLRHLLFANSEYHLERFENGERVYPFADQMSGAAAVYNITNPFAALKEAAQVDGLADRLSNVEEADELFHRDQPQQVSGWTNLNEPGPDSAPGVRDLGAKERAARTLAEELSQQLLIRNGSFTTNAFEIDDLIAAVLWREGGARRDVENERLNDFAGGTAVTEHWRELFVTFRDKTGFEEFRDAVIASKRAGDALAIAMKQDVVSRVAGLTAAEDIINPLDPGEVITRAGEPFTEAAIDKMRASGIERIKTSGGVLFRQQPQEELKARFEVTRLKAISNTRIEVAAANQVKRLYDRLFDQIKAENKDADRAQFFADHRVTDPEQVKRAAIESLRLQLELELGESSTVGDAQAPLPFDENILIDALPANEKALATRKLATAIGDQLGRSSNQLINARNRAVQLERRIARNAEAVQKIDKQLNDVMASDKIARDYLRDYLAGLSKDLKRSDQNSEALGELNATLAELEGRTNEELSTQFTDRVLSAIGIDTLSLPAIFKALFARESNGDFDLTADKPSAIRNSIRDFVTANPDSDLASLVEFGEGTDARSKGTALLAAVITLAKDQGHIVDTIRLQLTETAEAKQQLLAVRAILNETRETALAEALEKAKKDLKSPGSKAIYSWLKRRERSIADKKALERQDEKARYLVPSTVALRDTLARIDQRLGIGHNLNIVPGEQLMVPPSADATSDAVRSSLVEITMGRERWLKSEQVKEILKAQREWMDARADKPELHDEIYNTIARNHDKLMTLIAADDIHTTLGKLASGKHDSLSEELRRTNTRAGEAAARNIAEFGRVERAYGNIATDAGKRWEIASEQFYKASKLSPERAKELVYDPAFFFMADLPGITEDEALVRLRAVFAESPMTESIARTDATWKLLVNWLRVSTDVNKALQGFARGSGVFVRDEKLTRINPASGREEAAYRPAIEQGVTGYTLPQRVHGHVGAVISRFDQLYQLRGDGENNPFHDTALKMQMNPDSVAAALRTLIDNDPEFRTRIVEPLLTDTSRTHLPLPGNTDGRSVYVPPAAAERALRESKGDVLKFAEILYQRFGTDGSSEALRAYQAKVVKFLGDGIASLDRQVNPAEKAYAGLKGLAHYAMDARVASNFPRSWLTYDQFSAEDNRHALHTIASNAAFGRNFERQDQLYQAIHQELKDRADEINVADRDALLKTKGKDWFALREDAERKLGRVDTYKELTRAIMNPATGATGDFGPLMEVYGGVITGMVFGLKGAIKNTISIMDTLTLEKNFSVKSVGTVAKGYSALGRNFFAGLAGVFGVDLLKYNRNTRLIDEAGGFDVAKNVNTFDWLKGTRGVNNNMDKSPGGKVQRVARMARMFVSNARLGFSKGNTGPAIRAMNQFMYTQVASNYAITDALLSRFDEIANLGADFYAAKGNNGAKFTAKDVGYSDATGFESLRNEAHLAGFSFEEIADKALRRRTKNLEIFDKETVQKVMTMTLNRIAGEGGPASRPSYMLTSKFARANSALIGWSFFKSAQMFRLLRDPQGRRDLMTLANGAKVMALGLVPMAVAFSLLLDEYEDKLTGKRSNLKPITQEDFFSAVLERTVAMGSFGIAGNVPDSLLNIKDGTGRWGLSVDQGIVWLSSATGLIKTLAAGWQMTGGDPLDNWRNLNYANFVRPLAQSAGLGGVLQYVQIADNLFPEATRGLPVFEHEAGVTARINAGNLMRAAGRELGLEVRAAGGASTPSPVTPWVTNMTLAAYRDDREAFQAAYTGALKAAVEKGEADPVAYVKSSFQSRQPIKSVFRTTPTEAEYNKILSILDPDGRMAVQRAVNLFNGYATQLGIEPYYGAEGPDQKLLTKMIREASRKPTSGVSRKVSIDQMKAMLASRRMGDGY